MGAGPLGSELVALSSQLSRCQYRLVVTAAAFAESPEWILDGSPTPAHWLASVADVEECTAREWIRIGTALTVLPVTAAAFAQRRLSYSKVRTLTRTATPEIEAELVELVAGVAASEVAKVDRGVDAAAICRPRTSRRANGRRGA